MPGKCRFQEIWLEDPNWKIWLRKGPTLYSAFCTLCKKTVDVSHSGANALKSHENGKKHKISADNIKSGKQTTLHSFQSTPRPNETTKHDQNVGLGLPKSTGNLVDSATACCSGDVYSTPSLVEGPYTMLDTVTSSVARSPPRISSFLVSDSVTKAEILWTCNCVMTHTSTRSGGTATDLFPIMFSDSCIAQKMQLHKDKIAYSITYGLGPHFSNLVAERVKRSPFFALSIDESLNDICQKQQMDIMVNYWAQDDGCVATRYLTSAFLEKSSALDLLEELTTCVAESNLSLENLIQLSTDGPNVNLKLIFDIKNHMKKTLNLNNEILDTGTCSLHIVNGAYKTAHANVGWKLNHFLRSLYQLFKNYPSRRAVYKQITGSSVFPKKFCAIRWTENSGVIRRCLEMLPYLKTYVKDIQQPPSTDNFTKVKDFILNDKTLEAKLHFSAMVSEELEEFLVRFQRNAPLLPFLHQEVFSLMNNLAERFVKKKVMDTITSAPKLKKIDLSCDSNLKSFESVSVGFGAKSCLKNLKDLDAQKFKVDCKKFYISMFKKLMEKSPLNKRIVLGASCLNPTIMSNDTLRMSRIQVAIEELVVHNQITPAEGDLILREYKRFCENTVVQENLKLFNWKRDRLDLLFTKVFNKIKTEDVNQVLVLFVQRLLTCFHGNAAVERSFSFNKGFLVENLQEKSLIAQRALHDHINCLPGKPNS